MSHLPGGVRATAMRLIAALWLGAAAFLLFVAAPAAFRASDSPTNAANVVGAMLMRWHAIGIVLPLLLLILGGRRARGSMTAVLCIAVLFAVLEIGVDLRIRAIRESSPVPISNLPRASEVRKRFGLMHGMSSLLLLGQLAAAAATVTMRDGREAPGGAAS